LLIKSLTKARKKFDLKRFYVIFYINFNGGKNMKSFFSILITTFILFLPNISYSDATPTPEALNAIKEYKDTLKKPVKEKVPTEKRKALNTKEISRPQEKTQLKFASKKYTEEVHQNTYKTKIDTLIESGRYAEAIRELIPLVKKEPNNYELRYKLAVAYIEYGTPNKAIEELNNTIKLKPDFAPAHIKLAYIMKRKGNIDLALRELAQASELSPNNVDLKFQLGKIYAEKGYKDKATEEFKNILYIDPSYYLANIALSDILVEMRDYENAIEELKIASIYSPKNPEIHFRLGRIYMLQGNKNSAIEEYRILKDLNPEFAKNLFALIFPDGK
jgi:tetratricopeptide (TPR) repeat protein